MKRALDPRKSLVAVLVTAGFAVSGYFAVWAGAIVAMPVRLPVPPPKAALAQSARLREHAGPATLRLRFSGAGEAHGVTGRLAVGARDGSSAPPSAFKARPVAVAAAALVVRGSVVEFSMTTIPTGIVGLDLEIDPPDVPVYWDLRLDGEPWPDHATVAGGAYGLPFSRLRNGMATDVARAEAYSPAPQVIDPATDLGMFVHFDRRPQPAP